MAVEDVETVGRTVLPVDAAGGEEEDPGGNMKGVEILGGVNSGALGFKEEGDEKLCDGNPLTIGFLGGCAGSRGPSRRLLDDLSANPG